MSNLTTKSGDSGSAGMLGEKCVIIGAHNLDTKIDTNWCQQQKMTKKQQKSWNAENEKIDKTEKVRKVSKPENAKVRKVIKYKTRKSDQKKWQKLTPPQKGQNVT